MHIGTLPAGSKGFDCNTTVSRDDAKKFFDEGFKFVMRYVPRVVRASYDIKPSELIDILMGGLAVGIVQHVALPRWEASERLGTAYGQVAAQSAREAGMPLGSTLWLDLEEVRGTHAAVIEYCNSWHDIVAAKGFDTGVYVGYGCVLTADELYARLHFKRYWSAYNVDVVPSVRGYQMRQFPYPPPSKRVKGISFEYDENIVRADTKGDLPTFLIP